MHMHATNNTCWTKEIRYTTSKPFRYTPEARIYKDVINQMLLVQKQLSRKLLKHLKAYQS